MAFSNARRSNHILISWSCSCWPSIDDEALISDWHANNVQGWIGIHNKQSCFEQRYQARARQHTNQSNSTVGKTKCEPVLQTRGATQPAPQFSCADCVQLNHKCAFGITALVASLSEPRLVDGCRYIRDLCIIDGTKVNDKVALPTIALFYNRPSLTFDPPEIK